MDASTTLNINQLIGKRIRSTRKQQGLTQAQVAELLDMSIENYSRVENGKRGLSQTKHYLLSKAINADMNYIFGGDITASKEAMDFLAMCPKEKRAAIVSILGHLTTLW